MTGQKPESWGTVKTDTGLREGIRSHASMLLIAGGPEERLGAANQASWIRLQLSGTSWVTQDTFLQPCRDKIGSYVKGGKGAPL